MRLVEQHLSKEDEESKALACYGLLLRDEGETKKEIWLRFVDGRPVSDLTTQFLEWCCTRLEARGKKALFLIWDNASWHRSRKARSKRNARPLAFGSRT